MDLLSLLLKAMTSQSSVNNVSKKTGLSSSQISKLLIIAIPILLRYLTKNASSQNGASSLLGALTQHKTEKPVSTQIKEADTVDGDKIIGHILGGNQKEVTNSIAKETGVDAKDVAKVLAIIAPALLGTLSNATTHAKEQKQQGIDLSDGIDMSDILGLVSGVAQQQKPAQSSSTADLLGALLSGASGKKEDNGAALLGSLLSMMK